MSADAGQASEQGTSDHERGTSADERGASTEAHRTRPLTPDALDERATTSWAIGSVGSGGWIIGYSTFDLLNRESGRAHMLHVPTLGIGLGVKLGKKTVPLPSASAGPQVSYVAFETPAPMNFDDFDKLSCRITSVNMGIFWGYGVTYLTLWRGAWYFGDQVAYLRFTDWGAMLPAGTVAHGVTRLSRGSGTPLGEVDVPLILVPQEDDYVPEPLSYVRTEAREGPIVSLPGDLLFDFDSSDLRLEAVMLLTYLSDLLNNRRRYPVVIEGHTDSIGQPEYNRDLSMRRATAVKAWLVARGVHGARDFGIRAYGESRPLVNERRPDGSDDPAARARNRRVSVRASWNVF